MKTNAEDVEGEGESAKPAVCIIAHNAYGAMRGGVGGHIGGAEHQAALLARWLAGKGYRTSLVTWDEGQGPESIVDRVTILGLCRETAGIAGVRFVHPRTTSLVAAMERANADVYYHNSAEHITGLIAAWCQWRNRAFVYSVASDVDCEWRLPEMKRWRDRLLYRYGVRHAIKIVVQTRRQKELLAKSFDVNSMALAMPCRLQAENEQLEDNTHAGKRILWVGRIDIMKRLELLLDIAERLPAVGFDVVGANLELALKTSHLASYAKRLYYRAESLDNVDWLGSLAPNALVKRYRDAVCLCCTSSYEGFPNTFLEAWSQGCPVISSFDPDGIIQACELGAKVNTVSEFASAILRLISSSEMWREQSQNCLRYYAQTHSLEIAMPKLEKEITLAWSDCCKGKSEAA